MITKAEKREKLKNNQRKMIVTNKSIFKILKIKQEKSKKAIKN
jgi:hypothetical protein